MTFIPETPKDPDATLDYAMDWTRWLDGDTIISSSWTAPSGLTADNSSHDGAITTVWLSGGEAKTEYKITNRVVTAGGRTDDRTILLLVEDR